jgi:hypothetical protein
VIAPEWTAILVYIQYGKTHARRALARGATPGPRSHQRRSRRRCRVRRKHNSGGRVRRSTPHAAAPSPGQGLLRKEASRCLSGLGLTMRVGVGSNLAETTLAGRPWPRLSSRPRRPRTHRGYHHPARGPWDRPAIACLRVLPRSPDRQEGPGHRPVFRLVRRDDSASARHLTYSIAHVRSFLGGEDTPRGVPRSVEFGDLAMTSSTSATVTGSSYRLAG